MEPAEQTLRRLVEERLKALNTNAFQVETAHGLPEDSIRSILRGGKKSGTTLNKAMAACAALGISFSIGLDEGRSPEPEAAEPDTFSKIPVHAAVLSAGPGLQNGDAEIIDQLAFRRSWLAEAGVSAAQARVARVRGDSMAPGISDGDLVLIDTARGLGDIARRKPKDRRPPPIYAFIQDGEARVKRLERASDRTLILISDNPSFPAEVVDVSTRGFEILGQVVWSGHVWR